VNGNSLSLSLSLSPLLSKKKKTIIVSQQVQSFATVTRLFTNDAATSHHWFGTLNDDQERLDRSRYH
jgi:hypothetical protein